MSYECKNRMAVRTFSSKMRIPRSSLAWAQSSLHACLGRQAPLPGLWSPGPSLGRDGKTLKCVVCYSWVVWGGSYRFGGTQVRSPRAWVILKFFPRWRTFAPACRRAGVGKRGVLEISTCIKKIRSKKTYYLTLSWVLVISLTSCPSDRCRLLAAHDLKLPWPSTWLYWWDTLRFYGDCLYFFRRFSLRLH